MEIEKVRNHALVTLPSGAVIRLSVKDDPRDGEVLEIQCESSIAVIPEAGNVVLIKQR
jgi:hypothetical protein